MNTLLLILGLIALFFGLQRLQVWRMQRNRGKTAPQLQGTYGKAVDSGKPSLFYFYSPSCGACRSMTPVVKEYEGENSRCFPVDISREMDVARAFGVMATPSTVIVENGVIRDFLIGPQAQPKLHQLLAEARN